MCVRTLHTETHQFNENHRSVLMVREYVIMVHDEYLTDGSNENDPLLICRCTAP